jgi:hypothetical protein
MRNHKLYAGLAGLTGVALLGTMATAHVAANGATAPASTARAAGAAALNAQLRPLNNSGGFGHAHVTVKGQRAHVRVDAFHLARNLPHAQHIHFGADARHECPSVFDDSNHDHRLNVAEGVPAYGPIAASLTTRGDTSPASALAVDRFPTAPKGKEHYDRRLTFSKAAVARAIKDGKGVIVIHGVDYNGNGKYDFAGAGKSELDPTLPAEATDPAICGVLR